MSSLWGSPLLASDSNSVSVSRLTVELRPVGKCEDPDTSEPMPSRTKDRTEQVCLKQSVLVDENDIADAGTMKDPLGRLELTLSFKDKGAARLRKSTLESVGESVAVVINGRIFAVAKVMTAVSEEIVLSGGQSDSEIQQLVDSLRAQIGRRVPTLKQIPI
jgi:preprotein translocase subunit SecD